MAVQKVDTTLDELFANFDIEAYYAAKKVRHDRPWTYDIIRVLWASSGITARQLYIELWNLRQPSGLPMPKKFPETIRSCLNSHTSQSSVWSRNGAKVEDDLFYSPEGKGSGTWAVHKQRAAMWLKAHELPEA